VRETKVYLLDGGSLVLDQEYMFLGAGLTGKRRFPVYSVLVDHPQGRFLFDSGFDLEHVRTVAARLEPRQEIHQTLAGQLALIGIKPAQITHMLNSHYHFDHCGGNKHCVQATTICHHCELAALRTPTPARGYSDITFAKDLHELPQMDAAAVDAVTRRLETFSGDQEIARGVFLFETPGHTSGHCSLMVKLANRGPMLFSADACYSRQNLQMMCIQAGNHDPQLTRDSLLRLKTLAEEHDAEIFFSHDPESWPEYQRAPAFYA
jgi:4-pyridoxolactonase